MTAVGQHVATDSIRSCSNQRLAMTVPCVATHVTQHASVATRCRDCILETAVCVQMLTGMLLWPRGRALGDPCSDRLTVIHSASVVRKKVLH